MGQSESETDDLACYDWFSSAVPPLTSKPYPPSANMKLSLLYSTSAIMMACAVADTEEYHKNWHDKSWVSRITLL